MPALIERPKMTRSMYQALKKHIMKDREKKKQEEEHDAAVERMKKERELKKKKEEEDSLTLEQTKEQIHDLEKRLEVLKGEKHELFSQLKKVLHHEDESRKKAQLKEQSELMSLSQQYPAAAQVPSHPMFLQTTPMGRPQMYKPLQQQPIMPVTGIKRARSPSPPPVSIYQHGAYGSSKYPQTTYTQVKQEPYQASQKPASHSNYPAQASHKNYSSQSNPTQQQSQQSGGYTTSQSAPGKYPPGQSAFSSYPTHFAHHQKQMTDHYPTGTVYGVHRMTQPGYMGSPHGSSSLPLQQQLEHANHKSGFNEEKFQQMQQQSHRGMTNINPQQQQSMMQTPLTLPQGQSKVNPHLNLPQPPPQNKGSIVQGYPVRTQPTVSTASSSYQSVSSHSTQPTSSQIHTYTSSQNQRYY